MNWKWILFFVGATAVLGHLVASMQPSAPAALPLPTYSAHSTPLTVPGATRLRDTVLRWQALPVHQQTTESLTALTETLGPGICVFDTNNDGWQDLFLVGGSGHTRLYGKPSWWHAQEGNHLLLNRQGRFLEDVSAGFGVSDPMPGMGCAYGDLDNDGWVDLIVTGAGESRLYRNLEGTRFEDVTATSGVRADHWSTGASIVDFNKDGLLDIYIANYVHLRKGARTFERNKGFDMGNIAFDATLYDPLPNRLYLNKGRLRFEDVAVEMGVNDVLGRSLGSRWVDLNKDHWLDLIVINDAQTPNQVYLNRAGNRFERSEGGYAGLETPWSHDIAIADINQDGEPEHLISRHIGYAPVLLSQARGREFTDLAWKSQLASIDRIHQNGWGLVVADINNDSLSDVYIGNGLIRPDTDNPLLTQSQANTLLLGSTPGKFVRMDGADDGYPMSARGVVTADLNNDGQLEVLVANNNNPLQILAPERISDHHWLGLDIADLPVATRIEVKLRERTVTQIIGARGGFLSQGDPRIHIGLGTDQVIEAVTLMLPSGKQKPLGPLTADRYYRLPNLDSTTEPEAVEQPAWQAEAAYSGLKDPSDLRYLADMLTRLQTPTATALLYRLWDTHTDLLAPAVLPSLDSERASRLLWIVRTALNSADVDVQLRAIHLVRSLELEYSAYWLIPLLQSEDAQVACAVANAFEFFFDEEEAVTHRKYLAVAPLIKLLHHPDPVRQICAANALANAERKRAVGPLLQLSARAGTPAAQAAAIRALGLIRDTKAIEPLQALLDQPQNLPTAAAASILVALKRLNAPDLAALLDAVLDAESPRTALPFRIGVLTYLRSHPDGLVFQREQLMPYETANLQALRRIPSAQLSATDLALGIDFIHHATPARALDWMQQIEPALTEDSQRARWLLAMLRLQPSTPAAFDAFAQSASRSALLEFAGGLTANRLHLTESQLQALTQRLGSGANADPLLAQMLPALDVASQPRLSYLLTQEPGAMWGTPPEQTVCELLTPAVLTAAVRNTSPQNPGWIKCAYHNAAKQNWPSADLLQLRIALNRFDTPTTVADNDRTALTIQAARLDPLVAQTRLIPMLSTLDDVRFHQALDVIMRHRLTGAVNDLLWQTLRTRSAPPARRFHAACALLATEPSTAVIKTLNAEVFQHEIL